VAFRSFPEDVMKQTPRTHEILIIEINNAQDSEPYGRKWKIELGMQTAHENDSSL